MRISRRDIAWMIALLIACIVVIWMAGQAQAQGQNNADGRQLAGGNTCSVFGIEFTDDSEFCRHPSMYESWGHLWFSVYEYREFAGAKQEHEARLTGYIRQFAAGEITIDEYLFLSQGLKSLEAMNRLRLKAALGPDAAGWWGISVY